MSVTFKSFDPLAPLDPFEHNNGKYKAYDPLKSINSGHVSNEIHGLFFDDDENLDEDFDEDFFESKFKEEKEEKWLSNHLIRTGTEKKDTKKIYILRTLGQIEECQGNMYFNYIQKDRISERIITVPSKEISSKEDRMSVYRSLCKYSTFFIPQAIINMLDFSNKSEICIFSDGTIKLTVNDKSERITALENNLQKLIHDNGRIIPMPCEMIGNSSFNGSYFISEGVLPGFPCKYTEFEFKGLIRQLNGIDVNSVILKRKNNFDEKRWVIPIKTLSRDIGIPNEKDLEIYPFKTKFYYKADTSEKIKKTRAVLQILQSDSKKNIFKETHLKDNDFIHNVFMNNLKYCLMISPLTDSNPYINIFMHTVVFTSISGNPIWQVELCENPCGEYEYIPYHDLFLKPVFYQQKFDSNKSGIPLDYRILGIVDLKNMFTENNFEGGLVVSLKIPHEYIDVINKKVKKGCDFESLFEIKIDTAYAMTYDEAKILNATD